MLVMVENGIRGGICHAIHWYGRGSNKYKKDYDKNIASSYLTCWDVNNLYGWVTSKKLTCKWFQVGCIKTSQLNEDFTKRL